jgi:hypothetical protein
MYYNLNKIIKNIAEILKINEVNYNDSINYNISFGNINIEGEKFIRLMSIIFNDFYNYPSYQLFQNIVNINQFINEFIKNKDNIKELKDLDFKMQEKIYSLKKLKERIDKEDCENIVKIEILNVHKFRNIEPLCEANLTSLEYLKISHCSLEDISPLKKAKFTKIKNIN